MENILKVDKIEKYYGSRSSLTKAIDNLSFEVEKCEFVAIMGASGSGKTTLLNAISTIDKVTSGHIYVGGLDITKLKGNQLNKFRREELGFIFQDFNLLDTLTAYENIALALSIQNIPVKEIQEKIEKVATKIYGAKGVCYSEEALQDIKKIETLGYGNLPFCIAKTQYSFSDDAKNLECNNDYKITVRNVELKSGAGFIVVLAGKIMTMPGLPKLPAAENIDIDENGNVVGIF